jgi:uncharacterized protein YegJ (DUF2314 family)
MNRIKQLKYGMAFALLAAAAAGPVSAQEAPKEPGLVYVDAGDPKMEAAKRQGRSTLPTFFAHLASPGADEGDFALKFNLTPDRSGAEFIWAGELRVDRAGKITGVLNNVPIDTRFTQGQRVTIDRALIVDWGYRKGVVYQGNYTTRELLNRMSPDEAAQIRAALGW